METTTWATSGTPYRLGAALMLGTAQRLGMIRRNGLQAVKAITMMVASDATENFVDNELIPEAESLMLDYTVLDKPKKTTTSQQPLLFGIATGLLRGVITDKAGTQTRRGCPKLDRSRTTTQSVLLLQCSYKGIKTVIVTGYSRLERNHIIVPLEQRKEVMRRFSFKVGLGARVSAHEIPTPVMALHAGSC